MDYLGRLKQLRKAMVKAELSALVVSCTENVNYLSGFRSTDGILLITPKEQFLISDFRYRTQAAKQAPDYKFRQLRANLQSVAEVAKEKKLSVLGFEAHCVTVAALEVAKKAVRQIKWQPAGGLVEPLRQYKEAAEIAEIAKAAKIADGAYKHMLSLLKPGVTEREVAYAGEAFMIQAGAQSASFSVIVGGGPNSALPHNESGSRKLKVGDLVVLDLGAKMASGYCSDLTRTVAIGKASKWQQEIYKLVYDAQAKALAATRPGIILGDLDGIARKHIAEASYGDKFGHGLGHGVGLQIHEGPGVGGGVTVPAEVNQVITIEPGIYLPDRGGVRIEDLVVVTEKGYKLLSHAPKSAKLLIL
jgi:Xaa-Pro aminopeptidase